MSPRNPSEAIRWRLIGPALVLWLAAVIALAAFTSPTLAGDASTHVPPTTAVAETDTGEAPILTLALVVAGVAAVALRPARHAVVRRRTRDPRRTR